MKTEVFRRTRWVGMAIVAVVLGLNGAVKCQERATLPTPRQTRPAPAALPALTVPMYTKDQVPPTPRREDLPLQDRVTKDDVTWIFEKPARVGKFVNGDWYVLGPVKVVQVDPAPRYGSEVTDLSDYEKEKKRTNDELIRNGQLLNPPADGVLTGFDSRSRNFQAKWRTKLPVAMKAGDALVSTASEVKGHSVSGGTSPIKSNSILTCLAEPVAADAWRPSYGDRAQTIYYSRNLRRDKLLKLPVPAKAPDYQGLARDWATPWLEINYYGIAATRAQRPYGRALCQAGAEATLSLLMDYPAEEKEGLLIGYVQYGIDCYGLIKNGHPGWIGDGGWGAGRKWPMVFAGIMLEEPDMANVSKKFPKAVLAEDSQTFYDDCWTGARVCFAFDKKVGTKREAGWGAYENWHPSRWDSCHGQFYRSDMTGSTWVGQALAIHLLRAEKEWAKDPAGDPWLDYCDRWMFEPDPGFGTWGKQGEGYKVGGAWSWFKPMWEKYRMHPVGPDGKELPAWPNTGWQRTDPPQDARSVAVEIGKNREFRVKGQPFLPLMMFAETPERIKLAKAMGMNTVAEGNFLATELDHHCNNKELLDAVAKEGLYGVFGADMRVAGHPALLGWLQPDEPDKILGVPRTRDRNSAQPREEWRRYFPGIELMIFSPDPVKEPNNNPPQILVSTAYEWMKKVGKTRPVFLTLGARFMKGEGTLEAAVKEKEYPEYLKSCDVAGCGVYPATAGHGGGRPEAVARAVGELRALAGAGKPVFVWIEAGAKVENVIRHAGDMRAEDPAKRRKEERNGPAPTPAQTRAETWMALIGGATAIGYRGFEGFDEPKLDAGMAGELKRLNDQLTRLAPALLADPVKAAVKMALADGAACHQRATEAKGVVYVFCQSLADKPGRAAIMITGLKAGTVIEVVDENRTLSAGDGQFADEFAPLREHVYAIKL